MTRTCAPRTQRFGAWLIDSALVFLLWYLCTGSDLETVNVLMQTLDPTQPGALDQFAQAIFKMLTAFGLKAAFFARRPITAWSRPCWDVEEQ